MSAIAKKAHSDHGASSAHRWIACPGSIQAIRKARSEGVANEKSTEHSALGSAAHTLGEWCLKHDVDANEYYGQKITEDDFVFEVDDDMAEAVQVYLDTVRANLSDNCIISIERRFHLSQFDERFYGTNDALIYDADLKLLRVYDYKHGAGVPVSVVDNKQLKYYALGALLELDARVSEIELIIVQPRYEGGEPVQRWKLPFSDLMEYAGELIEAAEKTDQPDAPLNPGAHCRFCPVSAICKERERSVYQAVTAHFDAADNIILPAPDSVSPERMAVILDRAKQIEDWVKAVKAHAHILAEQGRPPDDYKLVDKYGRRKWLVSEDDVRKAIVGAGYTRDVCYTQKLCSPNQIEQQIGKAQFKRINEKGDQPLCEKVSTGTVLVPISDKREAVKPKNAPEDFFT